jgi:hypothetical protein
MKKITLLAVAALAITFTSCKKDYTCTCTTTYAGITATSSTTLHDTKSNATTACEKSNASTTVGGYTQSTSCAIK